MTGPRVIVRPGWKATLIEIATGEGPRGVIGLINDAAPGLAVTRAFVSKKGYGITHLRSGRLLWPVSPASYIRPRLLAEHLMLDLGQAANWSAGTYQALTADDVAYKLVVRSVYRVLGLRA